MTIPFRNALFVLASIFAGFLSGLLDPLIFGVHGAIVGGVISCTALFLQPRHRSHINPPLMVWIPFGLGIAAAATATVLIAIYHLFLPNEGSNLDFNMNPISTPMRFATILCYTAPLLMFYRERTQGRSRAWAWFMAGPAMGAMIRSLGYNQIGTILFNLTLGALPFALLWLLSAFLADPAWTQRRWTRCAKPCSAAEEAEAAPTR